MKKNMIITAGLLSTVSSMMFTNESYAVNEVESISEKTRTLTQLNKKGRVKNVSSNDVLNVRIEPNADSKLVFTLKNSTEINILAQDNKTSWYKISYNGQEGYASNRYIEIIGDMTEVYNVTADINLRKEANWSAEVVKVVKNGTKLDVISISGAWAKVNYNGTICYAPSNYLEKVGGETTNTPSTPSTPSTTKYDVTADINLRKEANWSAEVVTIAKKGTQLDVISIEGAWAKVSYNNTICYAPANYLEKIDGTTNTPSNPSIPSTPEVEKSTIATVTTDDLNIRAGGGMSFSILAKANKGDTVLILENKDANGWYKVQLTSGIVGYCYEDYLNNFREGALPDKPSNDNSSSGSNNASSVVSGQIATVNTDGLNVRSGTETIYPILSVVNTGDKVLIKEKDSSGWYKVQLSNGIVGWCNGIYLNDFKSGSITVTPSGQTQKTAQELIDEVIALAHKQIGKPYEYGATGPNSFDCSGLAQYVFKNGANISLPRNSKAQASVGRAVSKSNLQPGDLVFFNTSGSGISHLGIYIGNNQMIHAPSSGKKIQIVDITQSYWSSRYVTARRIIY